jgi:hypothetical protein
MIDFRLNARSTASHKRRDKFCPQYTFIVLQIHLERTRFFRKFLFFHQYYYCRKTIGVKRNRNYFVSLLNMCLIHYCVDNILFKMQPVGPLDRHKRLFQGFLLHPA